MESKIFFIEGTLAAHEVSFDVVLGQITRSGSVYLGGVFHHFVGVPLWARCPLRETNQNERVIQTDIRYYLGPHLRRGMLRYILTITERPRLTC